MNITPINTDTFSGFSIVKGEYNIRILVPFVEQGIACSIEKGDKFICEYHKSYTDPSPQEEGQKRANDIKLITDLILGCKELRELVNAEDSSLSVELLCKDGWIDFQQKINDLVRI